MTDGQDGKKDDDMPDFSDVKSGASSTAPGAEVFQTYEVKSGDSLSKIAKNFYGNGNAWKTIFDANTDILKDPNKIYPGQKLKIPPKIPPKLQVAVSESPFGQRREILLQAKRENRVAQVQQVQPAVEFARPRLGASMGALGDQAHETVSTPEEGEDLGGLAVFDFAKTDAAVAGKGHRFRRS